MLKLVRDYVLGIVPLLLTALAVFPLTDTIHFSNLDMVFLLPVVVTAAWLGRGPAILSVCMSVVIFAYFYVPPANSFRVNDPKIIIVFGVMLLVGYVTAELAAMMRRQRANAEESANHSTRLYGLARDLAGISSLRDVRTSLDAYMSSAGLSADLLVADDDGHVDAGADYGIAPERLKQVMSGREPMEIWLNDQVQRPALMLPLSAPMNVRGILVVKPEREPLPPPGYKRDDLRTIASLVGMVVERLHYVEVAQKAQLETSSERLRSSLLTALSHDLRTPMTSIVGLADNLSLSREPLPDHLRHIAGTISSRARAVNRLFDNLIKLAQLQSGRVRLRREWQLFEDVIGSGLRLLEGGLGRHAVRVDVVEDMPLVQFDAVLMERVVCNLVENAAKYSPDETTIDIRSYTEGSQAILSVRDHGPGFPPGPVERLFRIFERGEHETARSGAGLGLAICSAIIDAHGGQMHAYNHAEGGAVVEVILPLGTPPVVDPAKIEKESV